LNRLRKISILLAIVGLLLATLLIGWFGLDRVLTAMLSVSAGGFGLLCVWQMGLFLINGAAWDMTLPTRGGRRLGIMIWGRMVRDAAGNCLPFSQVGGFLAGIRAVTCLGISLRQATASTVVDVTAEFLAQIVFAAIGMLVLLMHRSDVALAVPMAIGLGLALGACVLFIWLQSRGVSLLAGLSNRIAADWFGGTRERIDVLQAELTAMYQRPTGVLFSFAVHMLGVPVSLIDALAIEGLLHAVLATAFLIPGYAGVQEAAYAGIGVLFGIPAEIAIAVSLLRRSRDIAVGVPILLVWQFTEMRRLRLEGP